MKIIGIPYSDTGGGAVGKCTPVYSKWYILYTQQMQINARWIPHLSYDGVAITTGGTSEESQTFSVQPVLEMLMTCIGL